MKLKRIGMAMIALVMIFYGLLPVSSNTVLAIKIPEGASVSYGESTLQPGGDLANIIHFSYSTDENGESIIIGTISAADANDYGIGTSRVRSNSNRLYLFTKIGEDEYLENGEFGIRLDGYSTEYYKALDAAGEDEEIDKNQYLIHTDYLGAVEDTEGNITIYLKPDSEEQIDLEKTYRVFVGTDIWADVNPITGASQTHVGQDSSTVDIEITDPETLLDGLERMLSLMINALAGFIHSLVSNVLISDINRASGKRLTIDQLVFNEYPETQLTYFYEPDDDSLSDDRSVIIWGREGRNEQGGWKRSPIVIGRDAINGRASNGESGLYSTVNAWYKLFRAIAVVGYMIMLVYMGIRIILSSTGRDLSRFKSLFMYWVIGIIILFFYPYVMKYTIILNDTFVAIVKESTKNSIPEIEYAKIESVEISTLGNTGDTDYGIKSPFEGGADYMSVLADQATHYKRFSLSIAYLIMTWQLITLVVHYYKRVFMTGFLITIFPLVALSYAIDKIADGKSQAFNKWNKEFILNVFIQTFHAIVYAFVCSTVYSSGANNIDNYDFILIIVGVTFLFTGEEIIKKIFSQESAAGTVRSLADTAAVTFAKITVAKTAISAVGKPFIGKNSVANRALTGVRAIKASNMKLDMYDKFASPMTPPDTGRRLSGFQEEMNKPGADKNHVRQVANSIATWNNPNSSSIAERAKAFEVIQKEIKNNPDSALLRDLKTPIAEFEIMMGAETLAATLMANGVRDPVVIEREVKIRLGIDVDSGARIDPAKERQLNMIMAHMGIYGADRGYNLENTKAEIDRAVREITNIENRMNIKLYNKAMSSEDMKKESDRLHAAVYSEMGGYESLSEGERKVARNMAVLRNLDSAAFTNETKLRSIEELQKTAQNLDGANSEKINAMLSTIDVDLGVASHILARKMIDKDNLQNTDSEDRNRAKELLKFGAFYHGSKNEVKFHDGYEGEHQRDTYFNDEVVLHEMVERLYAKDDMRQEIELDYDKEKIDSVVNTFVFGRAEEFTAERNAAFAQIMNGSGSDSDKTLAMSMEIIRNRESGMYTEDEQLKALNYVASSSAEDNETAKLFIEEFEDLQDMDFDDIRFSLAEKIKHTYGIDAETKESAIQTQEEATKRAHAAELVDKIYTERRKTNQTERELTSDFAQNYLANHGIDINEGGIDTETKYFWGRTREDLLVERRNAIQNAVRKAAGFDTHGTPGGKPGEAKEDTFRAHLRDLFGKEEDPYGKHYKGKSYSENNEAYNKHYYGDQ